MDLAYLATARTPYLKPCGCIKLDTVWTLAGVHCAVTGSEQKLTWPYLDFSNGDEIRKGSARPGSYKLVRPVGNGIPLSEVYRMRVSLLWPDSCNSCNISPIPGNTRNEILVLTSNGPPCVKTGLWGF